MSDEPRKKIDSSQCSPVSTKERKEVKIPECHKLVVRVKRPSGDGPWYAFGMLGGSGDDDDLTGHTFCMHVDMHGNKYWNGFYPKGAIVGWENVPPEDRIAGEMDFFKYVAGVLFHGDSGHPFSDEKIYSIDKNQFDRLQAFAAAWERNNTKYSLARNNCTTFVRRDAEAGGVSVPSGGFPFDNPASFGKNLAGR